MGASVEADEVGSFMVGMRDICNDDNVKALSSGAARQLLTKELSQPIATCAGVSVCLSSTSGQNVKWRENNCFQTHLLMEFIPSNRLENTAKRLKRNEVHCFGDNLHKNSPQTASADRKSTKHAQYYVQVSKHQPGPTQAAAIRSFVDYSPPSNVIAIATEANSRQRTAEGHRHHLKI